MKKPTVGILTLGCKVNQYESQAIAEAFEAADFCVLSPEELCDVYVINTCTVTAESDRKAGQLIRRAAMRNPSAFILVTGCFSQVAPDKLKAFSQVDYICGNTNKLSVVESARALLQCGKPTSPCIAVGDVQGAAFEPMSITRFDRTRAYVKIEDGCENRCTYCTIPAARGRVRSKPLDAVLAEVQALADGGCREVVLTGIETASWGRDLENASLIDLLEAVDRIAGIDRIRLGSLDPSLMKEDFVQRLKSLERLAPHFHLSMQSGSARILAAMKRKYNPVQALEGIERLRSALPCAELTTDFIVGFPGETDEDFADTINLARRAEFLQMHVFAYSRRAGTPAAAMSGQISKAVKKERSAALIALGRELRRKRLEAALQAPVREVLFETLEHGVATGHTKEFFEVSVPSPVPLHAQIRSVTLQKATDERLFGILGGDHE